MLSFIEIMLSFLVTKPELKKKPQGMILSMLTCLYWSQNLLPKGSDFSEKVHIKNILSSYKIFVCFPASSVPCITSWGGSKFLIFVTTFGIKTLNILRHISVPFFMWYKYPADIINLHLKEYYTCLNPIKFHFVSFYLPRREIKSMEIERLNKRKGIEMLPWHVHLFLNIFYEVSWNTQAKENGFENSVTTSELTQNLTF